ncbi:MAG: metallophosphoesterase [Bacteroidales bacterium]|nr:metallophosphoesterase [Bacteroidales bacterium]
MKQLRQLSAFSFIFLLLLLGCSHKSNNDIKDSGQELDFTFAFLTDIHLQPELNAVEGFTQAIDSVNKINPDFVITGGDLIMDALGQTYGRSDSLYNLYLETIEKFNMPVYNTMGNHEIFGIYGKSGVNYDHPEYGEKMFESRIGQRYYSFDYKGWHFMILDGIEDTGESRYIGLIDSVQIKWIQEDLSQINAETPIVVSTHIPFITVATQIEEGSLVANRSSTTIANSKEVLELFETHNLKLVLQGHLHFVEEIIVGGTHFITGGAVSSRWWGGRYNGMEEGFVLVKVNGNEFTWEYIDYDWEAEEVDSW